jgi:hypothetical protein
LTSFILQGGNISLIDEIRAIASSRAYKISSVTCLRHCLGSRKLRRR